MDGLQNHEELFRKLPSSTARLRYFCEVAEMQVRIGSPQRVRILAVLALELVLWSFAGSTNEFKNLAILACRTQTGLGRVSKLAGIGFTAGTISAILSRT